MPRPNFGRLQLVGEIFLLTSPFIEPNAHACSENVRNGPCHKAVVREFRLIGQAGLLQQLGVPRIAAQRVHRGVHF
jgi:hypothetical protein